MMLEAKVVLATLMDLNHVEGPSQVIKDQAPAPGNDSAVCPVNISETSAAETSECNSPVDAEVADVTRLQMCISEGEQISSSQGSELFNPSQHMRKIIELQAAGGSHTRPSLSPGSVLNTPVTPASSKICSLLFGAVFSDRGDGGSVDLPSLVCASDTEEDRGTEEGLR